VKAGKVSGLDSATPLRPNAARIARARLGELQVLAEPALEPKASKAQHDMRIAAKRLRYLLEIVGSCFGAEAQAAHDAARSLQSILGDLHDCDALLLRAAGIASLEVTLRSRREQCFQRFRRLWQDTVDEGTWTALVASLHNR
jgi:CHAD domain-containing protein